MDCKNYLIWVTNGLFPKFTRNIFHVLLLNSRIGLENGLYDVRCQVVSETKHILLPSKIPSCR